MPAGSESRGRQELADVHGRAFADFTRGREIYLAVARMLSRSHVLRWTGDTFEVHWLRPSGRRSSKPPG
jgi:hypothetical protein